MIQLCFMYTTSEIMQVLIRQLSTMFTAVGDSGMSGMSVTFTTK